MYSHLVFFRLLIDYTEDKGNYADRWKGYVYVVVLVIVAILQLTVVQHALHIAFKSAMRVHTSIVGVVYAKVRAFVTVTVSCIPKYWHVLSRSSNESRLSPVRLEIRSREQGLFCTLNIVMCKTALKFLRF